MAYINEKYHKIFDIIIQSKYMQISESGFETNQRDIDILEFNTIGD